MTGIRTLDVARVSAKEVIDAKAGRSVSVCIPCRDESATIGQLVRVISTELMKRAPVVDELIVLDDRSTDDTARVAAGAGATVVPIETIHRRHGAGHGKGNALWASVLASKGDFIVWCDGDVTSFEPEWVLRLVAGLLGDDSVALVKALYHRPTRYGGGGRTTELVARPLLSRYFPELTGLAQPLSGEFAGRRTALESIPFVMGWGTEIAMLIDVARQFGPESIAQVDLGVRLHRHRDLAALAVQAAEVMATLLDRAAMFAADGPDHQLLRRADGSAIPLNLAERPAIVTLDGGLPRTAHDAS